MTNKPRRQPRSILAVTCMIAVLGLSICMFVFALVLAVSSGWHTGAM